MPSTATLEFAERAPMPNAPGQGLSPDEALIVERSVIATARGPLQVLVLPDGTIVAAQMQITTIAPRDSVLAAADATARIAEMLSQIVPLGGSGAPAGEGAADEPTDATDDRLVRSVQRIIDLVNDGAPRRATPRTGDEDAAGRLSRINPSAGALAGGLVIDHEPSGMHGRFTAAFSQSQFDRRAHVQSSADLVALGLAPLGSDGDGRRQQHRITGVSGIAGLCEATPAWCHALGLWGLVGIGDPSVPGLHLGTPAPTDGTAGQAVSGGSGGADIGHGPDIIAATDSAWSHNTSASAPAVEGEAAGGGAALVDGGTGADQSGAGCGPAIAHDGAAVASAVASAGGAAGDMGYGAVGSDAWSFGGSSAAAFAGTSAFGDAATSLLGHDDATGAVGGLTAALANDVHAVGDAVTGLLGDGGVTGAAGGAVGGAVGGLTTALAGDVGAVGDAVTSLLGNGGVGGAVGGLTTALAGDVGAVGDAVTSLVGDGGVTGAVGHIGTALAGTTDALGDAVTGALPAILTDPPVVLDATAADLGNGVGQVAAALFGTSGDSGNNGNHLGSVLSDAADALGVNGASGVTGALTGVLDTTVLGNGNGNSADASASSSGTTSPVDTLVHGVTGLLTG